MESQDQQLRTSGLCTAVEKTGRKRCCESMCEAVDASTAENMDAWRLCLAFLSIAGTAHFPFFFLGVDE